MQQLIGVDDIPHPASMEGFAQFCWADPKQKIIHRATTPGLLTKADHGGYALLSLPALRDSDAIGSHTPSNVHDDHMKHTDLILKGISQSTAPKPSGRGGVHGSDNPPGVVSDPPP